MEPLQWMRLRRTLHLVFLLPSKMNLLLPPLKNHLLPMPTQQNVFSRRSAGTASIYPDLVLIPNFSKRYQKR